MNKEDPPAASGDFHRPRRDLLPLRAEILAGVGCWLLSGLLLAGGEASGQAWLSGGGLLLYVLGVSVLGYRILLHLSLRLWKEFWIRLLLWPLQALLGLVCLGVGLWLGGR